MAFDLLKSPASRNQLMSVHELLTMTDAQYEAEKEYWERIRGLDGFWQIEFAGDFMLDTVLEMVQDFRRTTAELGGLPHGVPGPETERHANKAIAGLALGALMRSSAFGPVTLEQGSIRFSPKTEGVDVDLEGLRPLAFVHVPKAMAPGFLPGYDPAGPAAYYQEGPVVVRAKAPAVTTAGFAENFANDSGGTDFDPSGYVTLRPQLLKTYVTPPDTPIPVV